MESQLRLGDLGIVVRSKNNNGFFDNSHLKYYNNGGLSIWCGEKTKNKKKEMKVEVNVKKRLKLLKGLSTNLSMYSEMGICGESVNGGGANMLSQLSRVLLDQLQQAKAEKKEIKQKKKEEKKKLKALRMKSKKSDNSDSSSSSSESSDDECDEVVNMKHLRISALAQPTNVNAVKETTLSSVLSLNPTASKCEETDKVSHQRSSTATKAKVDELQQLQFQADTSISSSSLLSVREHEKVEERDEDCHSPMLCAKQECCTSNKSRAQSSACEKNGSVVETFGERIDVCMGGKCKKFGAAELLEELQKKIGMEGAVVGCKCMGKCKNAPNVCVVNKRSMMNSAEGMDTSIRAPSNPLYLGVGLDDIDTIVSNFLGEGRKNIGSMTAAA